MTQMTQTIFTVFTKKETQQETGFTLLEIVLTLIILGVMGGLGATLFGRVFSDYMTGRNMATLTSQGQFAMERMVRTIRSGQCATLSPTSGSSSTLSFQDINNTTVTYGQSGTRI